MESLLIKGGIPLHGEVTISGAKNAVLPIMAATLLTDEPCVIRRVPALSDVKFMGQILAVRGWAPRSGSTATPSASHASPQINKGAVDHDLIRKMRGSICIMGPLVRPLEAGDGFPAGGCVDRRAA